MSHTSRPRGFTLVEMLVVIGIIGILAALLLPAVYAAVVRVRDTRMSMEIAELAKAIETYKQEKGDYPPNFRDASVVLRHIRRCYPKADPTHVATFLTLATDTNNPVTFIDEGECLVFWLAMTDADPTYPFLSYLSVTGRTPNPKKYFDFKEPRLAGYVPLTPGQDPVPSYRPEYAKETYYIYMDSRSYGAFVAGQTSFAFAEEGINDPANRVRPYWSEVVVDPTQTTDNRLRFKPMNDSTYQIVCAGQDGEFGDLQPDPSNVKFFPSAQNYFDGDKDNITNFSEGKSLESAMP